MRQVLIFSLVTLIIISCEKNDDSDKLPVDWSKIRVTEINENDSNIYKIYYDGGKILKIVNKKLIDYELRSEIYDSIIFFYSSNILDSAIRVKEIFRSSTHPYGFHGISKDSMYIRFITNNGLIVQKRGDVSGYLDTQDKVLVFDYNYDSINRLKSYFFGITLTYDGFNNITKVCNSIECCNYSDYDNNPNPYNAINKRLKYPYFDNPKYLSDNNVREYEIYELDGQKHKYSVNYMYDKENRVVEIDNRIKIKY